MSEIEKFYLNGDEYFPNNVNVAVVVYRAALAREQDGETTAAQFEALFAGNGWTQSWRDVIYPYQHYHSTAYEVLGVFSGADTVQLGGDDPGVAVTVELRAGDALLLPPGVAHKSLAATADFLCVGAYPDGQEPDLLLGAPAERAAAAANIARVPPPRRDPVLG